jgi:hypothetical protein
MDDNKSLVSINTSIARIEKQIAIGEKLLGLKLSNLEKERIKLFLIETVSNNYDIIKIISGAFPLTEKIIAEFKYKLDWSALSANQNIIWNEKLIDKYIEHIDWSSLSDNDYIEWNEKLIDKYIEHIDWSSLSDNDNIEWNEKLLEKYENYLDFNSVFFLDNPKFKLTYVLYKRFKDKIDLENLNDINIELPKEFIKENIDVFNWKNMISYTNENLEFFQDFFDWDDLSKSKGLVFTDELIEKFKHKWTWDEIIKIERKNADPFYIRKFYTNYTEGRYYSLYFNDTIFDEELLDSIDNDWVWPHFSRDINFKNNPSLLIKYANKWDGELLTYNNSIDWTIELIEKYKNNIDWSFFSIKTNLPWTEELIELYNDYWDWKILGMNTFLPWNIEFYKKNEHKFEKDYLFFHKKPAFDLAGFYNSYYEIQNYFVDYHFENIIPKDKFDSNLIFYVKDIVNWRLLSRKYEWTIIEIEKFKEYIDWSLLSNNRGIKWTIEILKKYKEKWDWEGIGSNRSVVNLDLNTLIQFANNNCFLQQRYTYIKIRKQFLDVINENDVIEILEKYKPKSIMNS